MAYNAAVVREQKERGYTSDVAEDEARIKRCLRHLRAGNCRQASPTRKQCQVAQIYNTHLHTLRLKLLDCLLVPYSIGAARRLSRALRDARWSACMQYLTLSTCPVFIALHNQADQHYEYNACPERVHLVISAKNCVLDWFGALEVGNCCKMGGSHARSWLDQSDARTRIMVTTL
jgi:hypothetical protein